ncbi:MAG: MFS transporter, partial [Alphaproteobacteria bacterium]|nr:MFS transporter [Alphaproteobacteria bacterium]
AYATMAGFGVVGLIATLLHPEPQRPEKPPRAVELHNRYVDWLQDNILGPFLEFLKRPDWLLILAVIFLYRYADILLGVMAKPFYLEMGYSKTQIAAISGTYGLGVTLVGAALAGLMVRAAGIMRTMFLGALIAAISNLFYLLILHVAANKAMYMVVVTIENLSAGIATTAFVAYFSFLCNRAFSVQQFALFTSVMVFGGKFFAAGGGWVADNFGWTPFFLITAIAGLPVLVLLKILIEKYQPHDQTNEQTSEQSRQDTRLRL